MALSSWVYRKKINISGASGAGTNYQVLLRVGESSGSSNYDFHLNGLASLFPFDTNQSGDLRFASDLSGNSLLDFWVERVVGTAPNRTAYIWVKISSNLDTDQSIYCFFNSTDTSNVSNGENTFLFFDDFSGDLNKWDIIEGDASIVSGVLRVGSNSSDNRIITNSFTIENSRVRARRKLDAAKRSLIAHGSSTSDIYDAGLQYDIDSNRWFILDSTGSTNYPSGPVLDTDYHIWEYTVYNNEVKGYVDDIYIGNRVGTTGSNNIQVRTWDSSHYSYTDWIFVSKYVYPEPSFSSAGATTMHTPTETLTISDSITIGDIVDRNLSLDFSEGFKEQESSKPQLSYEDTFSATERTLIFKPQTLAPPYHYETWYVELPTVGTSIGRVLKTYFTGLIQNVSLHCKYKGTSGQTKIDIKLNGTSIFSGDSAKPTLSYNASSNSASSDSIVNGIVSKDDELSLDIEEVATGAEGLTVTLTIAIISTPINVHSVTAIDNNNFSYTEKTNILTGNSIQIKFKVIFSTSLFYTPIIQLVNNTTYETTILELDELTTTSVASDTIITKSIDTADLVGDYTLIIKDGTSFSGATHSPYKANFTFLSTSISDFLSYNRYTNNSTVSITVDLTTLTFLSNYSYSLDGINWTEATELSSPFTIDITNSKVGGSNTEEDKTIYLRFSNPHTSGYLTETITIGYYYSPISFSISHHSYLNRETNEYFIDYTLPSTSTIVPPDTIEIRDTDSTGLLLYSGNISNIVLSGLSLSISDVDSSTWKISLTEGYLAIKTQDEPVYIPTQEISLGKPDKRNETLYLVYYDFNDEEIKVTKIMDTLVVDNITDIDENGSASTVFSIDEDTVKSMANTITDGIVLYGVVVLNSDQLYSTIYSLVEMQTTVILTVPDYVNTLYILLTDKAGREATQVINKSVKVVPLDIYVHNEYSDFSKVTALKNATIVNQPLDTIYIKLYSREGD